MPDTKTKTELEPVDSVVKRLGTLAGLLGGFEDDPEVDTTRAAAIQDLRDRLPGLDAASLVRVAGYVTDVIGGMAGEGNVGIIAGTWGFASIAAELGKELA